MNHEILFRDPAGRCVHFALSGARGGFARTLLAQVRAMPRLAPTILCDLEAEGVMALLAELGYPPGAAVLCETAAQAKDAAGRIAVVRDPVLLGAVAHDILVEATGQPEAGARMALDAIARGAHVAMVSKEVDSVVGPHLNRLAVERGLVYTTADGDQPANLIGLVTWARLLGFEVLAAGKSGEYDFVHDEATGEVTCADLRCGAPDLGGLWHLGADVAGTLACRAEALRALPQSATPDYCEMNVVSNSTGLLPACDALNYPLCRITELADVFAPQTEGGILERTGVVDVFNCLRRVEEVSFGGGVFVVVRCNDPVVWEMLRGKGHVVSRDGRRACIFLPYHLMGLETPVSLLSAVLHGRPSGSDRQSVQSVMVARAEREFRAGEVLRMGGHHHVMDGCSALLLPAQRAEGLAPFYLAANKTLRADVPAGALIPESAIALDGSLLQALRLGAVPPLPEPTGAMQ